MKCLNGRTGILILEVWSSLEQAGMVHTQPSLILFIVENRQQLQYLYTYVYCRNKISFSEELWIFAFFKKFMQTWRIFLDNIQTSTRDKNGM